jgi:Putative glucoamylase
MNSHNSTYFENSRRAALAQVQYAVLNPGGFSGYSSTVWGLTACDGPTGYAVHGIPPGGADDGTIAPTAAGGSMPFTPEYSLPTLRAFYSRFRPRIWTAYGFRDAFNITAQWYDTDELGIDEGPIVIMIENYRTQKVWRLFMQNQEVQRGLQRAGFVPLAFVPLNLQALPAQGTFDLAWNASSGRYYQVEYSPDLTTWLASPTGEVLAAGPTASWTDSGPPATSALPFTVPRRFYRVFQFGSP